MRLSRKALSLGDIFAFTQMKSCISKFDWIKLSPLSVHYTRITSPMLFESKQVKHYNCIYYGNYLNKCGRAYLFFLALHSTLILQMILIQK